MNYKGNFRCFSRLNRNNFDTENFNPDLPFECFLCSHTCNYPDRDSKLGFSCKCNPGYKLASDGFTCGSILPGNKHAKPSRCQGRPNSMEFGGRCYIRIKNKMSHEKAVSTCKSKYKGKIAVVDDRELYIWLGHQSLYDSFFVDFKQNTIIDDFQMILINSLRKGSLKDGSAVYVANLHGYADTMPRQVDLIDKESATATVFCEV